MSLYFGYKKEIPNTEELEKDISALKTGLSTNNTKTKSLESTLFKKDGTTQMTGDIDMGDNSIIGIDDINANNSVVSKKYVDDNLTHKLHAVNGTQVIYKITFNRGISMGGTKIQQVSTPTSNQDAANKIYVDGKVAVNNTEIGLLKAKNTIQDTKITALESQTKNYTYHFVFTALDTTYKFGVHKYLTPNIWMYCKDMTQKSRFHIHTLCYDSDSSIENDYTFTFGLDFLNKMELIVL